MGQTNSQVLNKTNNEDQTVTIIVEESDDAPQSVAPSPTQLKKDCHKLYFQAHDLRAEAALQRARGDELGAQQLDEECQIKAAEAKEKGREHTSQLYFGSPEAKALLKLATEAFALLEEADELMKKKPKCPWDFFKARYMYREARDKYWLLKRDLDSYAERIRKYLRRDEAGTENPEDYNPWIKVVTRRLDDLDTRLNQRIKAIDYFKEALTKPVIFIVIVLILIIIPIMYLYMY